MRTKEILQKAQKQVASVRKQKPVRERVSQLQNELPDVWQHSIRVTQLSVAIGIQNNLSDDSLRTLAIAGLLHDLGKLDVDEDILHKSGTLTETEKREINTHPRSGFNQLDEDFFSEIKKIVVAHHEHQADPYLRSEKRGSAHQNLSQIVAVADMYLALASDREYKESYDQSQIKSIMQEEFAGDEKLIDQACKLGKRM